MSETQTWNFTYPTLGNLSQPGLLSRLASSRPGTRPRASGPWPKLGVSRLKFRSQALQPWSLNSSNPSKSQLLSICSAPECFKTWPTWLHCLPFF